MNKYLLVLKHSWRSRVFRSITALLVLLLMGIALSNNTASSESDCYTKWIDPFIGIATFLGTIFVAMINLFNEWKDQLPKKLTVHFTYNGPRCMTCEMANLISADDIRAYSQQVGAQMSGGDLKLDLTFKILKHDLIVDNSYVFYEMTFGLSDRPVSLKPDEYRVWKWNNGNGNFDKESLTLSNAI